MLMVGSIASLVIEALEAERIDYMLVGAYSSGACAIPRGTKDVDIVISLASHDRIDGLVARLSTDFEFNPQVTFETITGSKRYILKSGKNRSIIIELFLLGAEPYGIERFRRRKKVFLTPLNKEVWIPSAEDVVVQKLRWARAKDLDDAKNVLAVQTSSNLDMDYIERWCEEHGSMEHLTRLLSEI